MRTQGHTVIGGYSSLVYLKRFPVDLLKVDRSFVAGLGRNRDDCAIARSVIDLAHAFGIAAVAEGIETPDQLAELQRLGCQYGQGLLWSPGRPAADLGSELLLSRMRRSTRASSTLFTPPPDARHQFRGPSGLLSAGCSNFAQACKSESCCARFWDRSKSAVTTGK